MKYSPIDLHCHSTHSDGSLSVVDVLKLSKENGGNYQALTDHDTVDGLLEAQQIAQEIGINLINGVEISVTWQKNTLVHIVGLNIDPTNEQLNTELKKLRLSRVTRAQRMAKNLEKAGIYGAFEGALSYATIPEALSRTHFNKWLVAQGYAKEGKAFEKYLAQGKVGYSPQVWASLEDAINWINQAGGFAIIAHPARYGFTRTKLVKLVQDFKELGGIGFEVISSSHSEQDVNNMINIAKQNDLLMSCGSDFHQIQTFRKILPGKNNIAKLQGEKTVFPLLNIPEEIYS